MLEPFCRGQALCLHARAEYAWALLSMLKALQLRCASALVTCVREAGKRSLVETVVGGKGFEEIVEQLYVLRSILNQ